MFDKMLGFENVCKQEMGKRKWSVPKLISLRCRNLKETSIELGLRLVMSKMRTSNENIIFTAFFSISSLFASVNRTRSHVLTKVMTYSVLASLFI